MPKTPSSDPRRTANPSRRERRLARQAEYQRTYRETQRKTKAPSRIDVANLTLHWLINLYIENKDDVGLMKLRAYLIHGLVEQGFDEEKTARRVDDIIERTEDGWTFRPKAHLSPAPGGITLAALMDGTAIDPDGSGGRG
ncbi:hypothetical protein [Mangrovibrevibacter kandeliae]|uniref:hypothetical protein n=1 Tax=Mangrovibrevibacter kandeliae TaxID=2968473 RepID=UPI0021175A57|nr:hypothetical protein [Aurantimonas sp. CSK15Z-1]MCQ8782917.1 hypothetical protein [Aurantimonas sp. CSK15Z-1]